jgi:transcriptional regulator with XRE-family HTH domain
VSKLSEKLKEIRLKAGLTQEVLAELINTTSKNYSSIETGNRSIGLKTLTRIASVKELNVTINELLALKIIDSQEDLTPKLERMEILRKIEKSLKKAPLEVLKKIESELGL